MYSINSEHIFSLPVLSQLGNTC